MASILNKVYQLGKTGCSACIRTIEPKYKRQKIELSVGSRITKWNTELSFRTALLNTLSQWAIRF